MVRMDDMERHAILLRCYTLSSRVIEEKKKRFTQNEMDENKRNIERRYYRHRLLPHLTSLENPTLSETKRKHSEKMIITCLQKIEETNRWTSPKYQFIEECILELQNELNGLIESLKPTE